ncbi:MAG: hypothetical protein AAF513_03445 [Pseudomonadota bacterium]
MVLALGLPLCALMPSISLALEPDDVAVAVAWQLPLADRSDEELTALTAQWAQLDATQRRALLGEVRRRMKRQALGSRLPVRLRNPRSYGKNSGERVLQRVTKVRKPDGSVVVRTEVVRLGKEQNGKRRVTFGVGFERRRQGAESVATSVDGGGATESQLAQEGVAPDATRAPDPVPVMIEVDDPDPVPGQR